MRSLRRPRLAALSLHAVLTAAALLGVAGCGGSSGTKGNPSGDGIPIGQVVPDFSLTDVNPASATSGLGVSPRDHLGSASAWYFGHAT